MRRREGGEEEATQRGRAAMLGVAPAFGVPSKSRLERLAGLTNSESSRRRLFLSAQGLIAACRGLRAFMPAGRALRDTPKMAAGGGRASRRGGVITRAPR